MRIRKGSVCRACSPPGLVWLCAAVMFPASCGPAAAAPARAQDLDLCSEERLEKQNGTGVEKLDFELFPGRPDVFAFEPLRSAAGALTAAPARLLRLPFPFASASPAAPDAAPKKHFWIATGEVAMLNVGMWLADRYILEAPWAPISWATWKANLRKGLVYDHDDFPTNQAEHPYNGSFYHNAARANGFNFWESALFATAGSLQWEFFGENEPASLNDVLSTSLGGAVQGEVFYRLSTMLVDNRASGSNRLWRELGAFVMNPIAGFNRFFRGEMTKDFPNPDDRMPAGFSAELYAGYQHLGDGPPGVVLHPNQGLFGVLVRYGDAFSGENRKPFDYFEALVEITPRSRSTASTWLERGLLASWGLSSTAAAEHRLGLFMGYEYTNNQSQIFSAETFSANLLSRFSLSPGLELRTEVLAAGFPMAALQTDYTPEEIAAFGRPYDFGPGGGVRSLARLHRDGLDLLSVGYEALWIHTSSGASLHSRLQALRLEGRLPVYGALAAGAAWTWNDRVTVYENRIVEVQGAEWRVFASLLLR